MTPLHSFTAERGLDVAQAAAEAAGLDHSTAELVRLGSNAIVRLPGGVVARVARDESWTDTSQREVRITAALADAGVPCIRPWPVPQPVVIDGHPVTFWVEIPGPHRRPTMGEFGAALRQLHAADVTGLGVPALDPWSRTPERIEEAPISDSGRRALRTVLHRLQDEWPGAQFTLDAGLIHGDAHIGNAIKAADGTTVLIDFDSACAGPREWDLAPTALYATSLRWISPADYRAFADAYGFDVTTSPAFALLARMRELRMTAWIAMHAHESPCTAAEVEHRIACLVDPDLPRHWSAR